MCRLLRTLALCVWSGHSIRKVFVETVGWAKARRAHLGKPVVGTRSLSSGRPNGSGLWPARWQAPAGPVTFAHPTSVRGK